MLEWARSSFREASIFDNGFKSMHILGKIKSMLGKSLLGIWSLEMVVLNKGNQTFLDGELFWQGFDYDSTN